MVSPIFHRIVRISTLAFALTALLWLVPSATPAHAIFGSITVNTLADNNTHGDGLCTLREAIANANNAGDITSGDCAAGAVVTFIGFNVSGTIILTGVAGGPLPISAFVSINGGNTITLSGGGDVRIFNVTSGWSLTLNNLVLTDGHAGSSQGGALYVDGATLVLDHTTIQSSRTSGFAGGAIFASGGAITLQNNSVVQGNYGYNYGAINSTGAVTVTNSIVRNNTATTGGGALSVGGAVNIDRSQIYNNTASTGDGGAIYISSSGNVTLNNSRLDSNHAPGGHGGGIYNEGMATLTNSTLSGNHAGLDGGGIFISGDMTLTNVTLSGNSAKFSGGIDNQGTATLKNTLIANSLSGQNCSLSVSGSLTSNDYNLSTDDSCVSSFNKPHDWNTVNVNLGPLANNGGPTLTHIPFPLPPPGNRAIDGGNGCPLSDQRGVMRPQGAACDIGAVEYVPGEKSPWLYVPLIVR